MIRLLRWGSPLAVTLVAACGVGGGAGATAAQSPAAAHAQAQAGDIQQSWAQLRAAILAHDLHKVADFAVFPLSVHGVTDDEVRRVSRAAFPAAFDRMLKQGDDGGSPTNLERIRATPQLTDPGASSVASVGGMELKRTPAGLRIVRIYVEEE